MVYRDLDKLTPQMRSKVQLFLEISPEVFVTETWRSKERQQELYGKGRTKAELEKKKVPVKYAKPEEDIVTWTLNSSHNKGEAIDIAFNGEVLYPENNNVWAKVAEKAKYCGLDWGFDLWGVDMPHFSDDKTKFDNARGQIVRQLIFNSAYWNRLEEKKELAQQQIQQAGEEQKLFHALNEKNRRILNSYTS